MVWCNIFGMYCSLYGKNKILANMQSLIQFRKKLCHSWPNFAHEYEQRGEKEQNHIFARLLLKDGVVMKVSVKSLGCGRKGPIG